MAHRLAAERSVITGGRVRVSPGRLTRVPADFPPEQPVFRVLDRPRPPTAPERRLLSWLVDGICPELTAQVAESVVVGECTCGCSSVELSTAAGPLPTPTLARLTDSGRLDYASLNSTARSELGHRVDIVLHIVDGRLHELEIFDIDAGEGTAVDLNSLTSLDHPHVG
jgi:hypothetical protein